MILLSSGGRQGTGSPNDPVSPEVAAAAAAEATLCPGHSRGDLCARRPSQ